MVYLYILLGYLLSMVGFAVYHYGIKDNITPKQRKIYIYALVSLSLALPAFFVQNANLSFLAENAAIVAPDDFVNEPVLDKALKTCYEQVATQEGLCHCEQLQQSNLLYYEPNPAYNFLIENRATIKGISTLIAILMLLSLLMKIGYLRYIIATSEQSRIFREGKEYFLLKRKGQHLAASFRLLRPYILWHPNLDNLVGETEQEAILMHEIAHLKNGDTFEQIGLIFLQIFWFLNPVFYFIKKELDLLNEYLADAFALQKTGNARSYAVLLVKLKEQQQLGLAQHLGAKALKARILAILNPQQFIYMRYLPMIMIGITAILLSLAASTAPVMAKQYALYEEYCVMHSEFDKTGKAVFCRSCLYKDLLEAKKEMTEEEWRKTVKIHQH